MARTNAQVKGDALEDAVRMIEMVILGADPNAVDSPIKIERKKILKVQGVRHEIDIYITITSGKGYISTYIFECKNWQDKIDKDEIIVFARKVADLRATKGFFVARRFTKDAVAQANRDGIELLTADDVVDTLPPFMDTFHILSNLIISEDSIAKLMFQTSPQAASLPSGLNTESFVKYGAEDMLLGKLVKSLQQQVADEYTNRLPSATMDKEKRKYKHTKTIGFSSGELFVEGL